MGKPRDARVIIIGTGFSGLGMAIQLKKAGIDDFIVLEKGDDVGGTWRDNSYPGCACDIQSHMYSFSFEQNPNWSRAFPRQQEIWDYLRFCAVKYDLRKHIQFGVELNGGRWDEDEHTWYVNTTEGKTYTAQYVVMGVGGLHLPMIPKLAGLANFQGKAFHSAQWDHSYDLRGKRVAVIGTGASAIQFVPEIAPDVEELKLFQRTPPWVTPKPDYPIPPVLRQAFKFAPPLLTAYRYLLYWMLESRAIGFNGHPKVMKAAQKLAETFIKKQVKDPALREKVIPDYTMGCKRVLLSNNYYPALNRDNVDVVTDGITEVRENSILTADGVEHEVDAIVFGTGFHVTDAFDGLDITGRGGRNLSKTWSEHGMQTYKGINVTDFPNAFLLLGPNTALGHNSVVFMIESQIKYAVQAIKLVEEHRAEAIDVLPQAQDEFQQDIQQQLFKGVWTQGGCTSWYLDAKGVNRTIWPGFTWKYWLDTNKVKRTHFRFTSTKKKTTTAA